MLGRCGLRCNLFLRCKRTSFLIKQERRWLYQPAVTLIFPSQPRLGDTSVERSQRHSRPRLPLYLFLALVFVFFLLYTVGLSAVGGLGGVWTRANTDWNLDPIRWL